MIELWKRGIGILFFMFALAQSPGSGFPHHSKTSFIWYVSFTKNWLCLGYGGKMLRHAWLFVTKQGSCFEMDDIQC